MSRTISLEGAWQCEIEGQSGTLNLPGTLDESDIGFPDDPGRQWKAEEVARIGYYRPGDPIVTRLTRRHTFEGQAAVSRLISLPVPPDKRLFVEVERARHLRLLVNGREAAAYHPITLSTPCVFEVTGLLSGNDRLVFLSDNSYPGWPRDAIEYSSAASDETQTNWNGLLGFVRLRMENKSFIDGVRVALAGGFLEIILDTDFAQRWEGILHVRCGALREEETDMRLHVPAGRRQILLPTEAFVLKENVKRWDVDEGNLYTLTVDMKGVEAKTVTFGIREFEAHDGDLTLNGRRFFLRGETNCAVFPETGYPPMDRQKWKKVFTRYRAYGVNCVRFHSHCPPEAAFAAADEMGMLLQPELSHWDPEHAFESPEARRYYRMEFLQILRMLYNHPSFVMLTLGNELHADRDGHAFMDNLLAEGRERSGGTRLFANGSNPHYGALGPDPGSDFYTSADVRDDQLRAVSAGFRGWLNQNGPDFRQDYEEGAGKVRKRYGQPVFSFEVGQYEILPDFRQINDFQGITRADNLTHIQRRVCSSGLEAEWERRVEATGELALLCYRAEVEAALRTESFSGISLLGLQDFPGQGTALVGMMDAHLQPKPYAFARPERFHAFFRDTLPLALLPRVTYNVGEHLRAQVHMANYGKRDLRDALEWTLEGKNFRRAGKLEETTVPRGSILLMGELNISLAGFDQAEKLTLLLRFGGTENQYSIWVYPDVSAVCPAEIHECRRLDGEAWRILASGGRVFLAPDATEEALPHSIRTQFSTDFWSVCTFPEQPGGMGQLIDDRHPLFRAFPTSFHTDWQWYPMAIQRAVILPESIRTIVSEIDSYVYLRPMAKLFECRCGGGRLLFSSMNLHHLQEHPEARALLCAIYSYMASGEFVPRQELSPAWMQGLLA